MQFKRDGGMILSAARGARLGLLGALAFISCALPLGGCTSGQTELEATEPIVLVVVRADGTQAPFTLTKVQSLPQSSMVLEGSEQEGPLLLVVLKAAGVATFERVVVRGSGKLELSHAQVYSGVILDLTNRGTFKLAGEGIPKGSWVKDVREILVY